MPDSSLPEPGWTRVPDDLLRAGAIPHRELRVLLLLLSHRNRGTGRCNPAQATLAREAGISADGVKRALRWLREHGLVDWKRSGRGSNWYFIHDARWGGSALSDGADLPYREGRNPPPKPEEGNQMTGTNSGADAPLGGVDWPEPDPPPKPEPNAGHLVAAWCAGWSGARGGEQPRAAVVKRMSGTARETAKHCYSREDWLDAWEAAGAAGRRGLWDLVGFMADYQPRRESGSVGLFTALARGEEEGLGSAYDPPQIGGPE